MGADLEVNGSEEAGNGVVTDVVNGAPTSEKGASRSKKRREKKKAAKADELELASDYRSLCETKLKEFDPDIELPLRELEKMAHSAEARTLEAQTQARQMKTQLEVTEKELATARLKAETLQWQGEEVMEEAEEEKKPAKKGAAVRCGKKGRGIHGAVRVGCGGRGVGLGWGVDMRDQPRMSIPLWGGGAMKREERGAVLAWAAKGVGDGGETRTWVRWGGGAMKREERGAVLDWAAKGVGDGGETHTWVRWGGGAMKREARCVLAMAAAVLASDLGTEPQAWVSAHLIWALRDRSTSHNSGGRFRENLRTARHVASRSKTLTAVWCTVADPTHWTTSTPMAQDAISSVALAAAPVAAAITTAVLEVRGGHAHRQVRVVRQSGQSLFRAVLRSGR
ncbi:hypothetical protein CYMTET_14526 [Cymbomonas tetramitiformis]|uniref:Uncharacterized protein n=1 Tax=Cymbomonas tetramitiformis TaxID=36881 RepID=A0AAE0GG61_9CHLO|nr:hypothetical protein CYMTET_14526 [Cymbomonas tetramitiformis]